MEELNPNIVAWFESGRFREALSGEGEFFLANNTYRQSHDILLIWYVLIQWALRQADTTTISRRIEEVLNEIAKTEPWKAADILLAYGIRTKSIGKSLPCNFSDAIAALNDLLVDDKENQRNASETLKDVERRLRDAGSE